MTTDWPNASPNSCVIWRFRVSVAPPGGNATTRRIGRSGNDCGFCACASPGAPNRTHAIEHHRMTCGIMLLPLGRWTTRRFEHGPATPSIGRRRVARMSAAICGAISACGTLPRISLRSSGLHIREQPVADIVDAQLAMIDLAVLRAALVGGENPDVLALGADPLVERLRSVERNDPVVLAVQDQERAFDVLRDSFERELLR